MSKFFSLPEKFFSVFILFCLPVLLFRQDHESDSKFTIILLPDTQFYSEVIAGGGSSATGGNIDMLQAQTNWIVAHRKEKNIVYVGQLGDCVQNGDNPPVEQKNTEWIKASKALSPIEDPLLTGLPEGIPYGICVGNHDQTPTGDPLGTTTYYNQYFATSHFESKSYYGGHYGVNNDNHYELFTAGNLNFMVISLEYDQTSGFTKPGGALDWAENLIKTNEGKKVIVMTHYGLNEAASGNPEFSIQGKAVYERLKQYPNFILFLCGHICHADGEDRRTDRYNGNTVHTLLADYQCRQNGGDGLLRIMEFDPVTYKVLIKTYSPYTGKYETDEDSQFELNVNLK